MFLSFFFILLSQNLDLKLLTFDVLFLILSLMSFRIIQSTIKENQWWPRWKKKKSWRSYVYWTTVMFVVFILTVSTSITHCTAALYTANTAPPLPVHVKVNRPQVLLHPCRAHNAVLWFFYFFFSRGRGSSFLQGLVFNYF